MERTVEDLREIVYDEADFLEIDVARVQPENTKGAGTAVRIIGKDGATEAEQVGFTAAHPGTADGDKMFRNHVKTGLRKLRQHLNDTDAQTDTESETDDDQASDSLEELAEKEQNGEIERDEREDRVEMTEADPEPHNSVRRQEAEADLTIEVTIDDDSFARLEEKLDEIREEAESERVEELEERVQKIEDTFSQLGN